MKYAPNIAGALLGLLFVVFGLLFLFNLVPMPPPPPEGSHIALFMGAFHPSGYLHFVKVMEVLGGLLVAIPLTRNFGLLILTPIIVNIVAFHVFIARGGLLDPILIVIVLLTAFLIWCGRHAFAKLLN